MLRPLAFAALLCSFSFAKEPLAKGDPHTIPAGSSVFIESADGFDIYLSKAIETKKIPLVVVGEKGKADFVIATTASQGQRTAVGDAIGSVNDVWHGKAVKSSTVDEAAMKVVNAQTGVIVFTYEAKKTNSFRGKKSVAEALAKHLNDVIVQ